MQKFLTIKIMKTMKKTLRKSTVLFMALAVFAMIFTGCKKDSSSNNSSGGGGGDPTPPPTGNYGTIVVGDQTYTIHIGVYTIDYDEDLEADEIGIVLADAANENANMYILAIPYYDAIPTGTFTYYTGDEPQQGHCGGLLQSNNGASGLYCTSGSVTISKTGTNYKIESDGQGMSIGGAVMNFSVDFEGPLTFEEE